MILQTDLTRAQLLGEALKNARSKKKFVLRVMRKSKKKAGQYIASRFLKDSPECLLTELLKNAGKIWTSRSL